MLLRFFTLASYLCVLSPLAGGPQENQIPKFRSGTRMVAIFATVQGRDGRLVPNLSRDDFQVLDNRQPVDITVFSNEPQPITAVVMLDMSASMFSQLLRVRTSLGHFVATLRPEDRIRIGSFGKEVALSHSLTGDREVLARVIQEELWPGGASPLWRALDVSAASLAGEGGRRVVLVLTDGVNYAPGGRLELPEIPGGFAKVKERAIADADLMFYAVGYGDPRAGRGLKGNIVNLTEITGGGHANVPPSEDLGSAFAAIGEELRHQYLIGFMPASSDGKVRTLEVRSNRPGLKVRARTAYIPGGAR